MSEKRSFGVSAGETPEFLKLPENREKADAFIQLSDMLVGFSGKAKITNRLFHAMFPSGLGREDRVVRIKLLQQVLKKNPDVVLRTSQDFGMHSTVSVPELYGVDHERRLAVQQGSDQAHRDTAHGSTDPVGVSKEVSAEDIGFIRLSDVLEGFSGKAKITKRMWRTLFPEGVSESDRASRMTSLRAVLEKRPDAVLKGSSIAELNTGDVRHSSLEADDEGTRLFLTDLGELPEPQEKLSSNREEYSRYDDAERKTQILSGSAAEDDIAFGPAGEMLENVEDAPLPTTLQGASERVRRLFFGGRVRRFRAETGEDPPFDINMAQNPFPKKKEESGPRSIEKVPDEEASHILDEKELRAAIAASSGKKTAKPSMKRA